MFPVGVLIATIAMMFGIGGAIFFSPLFFLLFKLPPDVAFATSIIIEIFGFGSGFIGYAKKKMIDYWLGGHILVFTIPTAIIGVIAGKYLPSPILQIIFAFGIIFLGFRFILKDKKILIKYPSFHAACKGMKNNTRCYIFSHKVFIYSLSSIGSFFLGLLSSGLGEINEYNFIKKLKMHSARSSGTSVFIVVVTALVASVTHMIYYVSKLNYSILDQSFALLIFTIPGVVLGAQIGVSLVKKVSEKTAKKSIFILFVFIGIITLLDLIF